MLHFYMVPSSEGSRLWNALSFEQAIATALGHRVSSKDPLASSQEPLAAKCQAC